MACSRPTRQPTQAGRGWRLGARQEEGRHYRQDSFRWTGLRLLVLAAAGATCGLSWAAGKEDQQGALIALAVFVGLTPLYQFLIAALFPVFTRRVTRALRTEFWSLAGWGALFAVLTLLVGLVLAQGGDAGQAFAGLGAAVALLVALAGTTGAAKIIGDWSLARWGKEEMGPLSVVIGGPLFALGALVPLVGNIAGLLLLFCGLGAGALVLLRPASYDAEAEAPAEGQPAPEAAPSPPDAQNPAQPTDSAPASTTTGPVGEEDNRAGTAIGPGDAPTTSASAGPDEDRGEDATESSAPGERP